jgi:hypothetical protein
MCKDLRVPRACKATALWQAQEEEAPQKHLHTRQFDKSINDSFSEMLSWSLQRHTPIDFVK